MLELTRDHIRPAPRGPGRRRLRPGIASILLFIVGVIFLSSCAPARLAIYSRPGGAEVFVDDRLVSRTISEVDPVQVDVEPGKHVVNVEREGYIPWQREVTAVAGKEIAVLADLVMTPPPPPYDPRGTLEIKVSPGSARILLNGREIGYTRAEPGLPLIVENLEPGIYEVTILREGYVPSQADFAVYANQKTQVRLVLDPLTPYYIYASNDNVLRQAVMRSLQGIPFMAGMNTRQSIALVNMDRTNDPINTLIEDLVVAELSYFGRPVAEREDHLLVRIANEAARGETLQFDILTHHLGPNQPFLYDARLQSASQRASIVIPQKDGPPKTIYVKAPPINPASIPTADQILGYRVVEKTVRVDPSARTDEVEDMLRREVILKLHFRLVDAKTGIVHSARPFEAAVVDFVPERVYRYLASPPGRLYSYRTEENSIDAEDAIDTGFLDDPEVLGSTELFRPDDVEALFWYYRNIGEAYLRNERYSEAEFHLREAVRLRPNDYDSQLFLAMSLLNQGKIDEAAGHYKAAVAALVE